MGCQGKLTFFVKSSSFVKSSATWHKKRCFTVPHPDQLRRIAASNRLAGASILGCIPPPGNKKPAAYCSSPSLHCTRPPSETYLTAHEPSETAQLDPHRPRPSRAEPCDGTSGGSPGLVNAISDRIQPGGSDGPHEGLHILSLPSFSWSSYRASLRSRGTFGSFTSRSPSQSVQGERRRRLHCHGGTRILSGKGYAGDLGVDRLRELS